ncbi:MAG TPA: hypothetical protein VH054_22610 [Polyangiaceae bacterium]|jgi:hypothetical protein|nr:hypothetical protein [Polyangiaceae bacterium]
MRKTIAFVVSGLGLASVLAGCGSQRAVHVTLSSTSSFATTGGNLFNCSDPAQAATPRALSGGSITCEPEVVSGKFTTTPVIVKQSLGCGDGHGAIMTVTCAGTGNGDDVAVTVSVAIGSSCDASNANLVDEQPFTFADIAPQGSQTTQLAACADFDDFCTPTNTCEFNAFQADVTVTNTLRD